MMIGDDGELIQIVAAHHFDSAQQRRLRRDRADVIERAHDLAQSGEGPPGTIDVFDFVGRDQAFDFALLDDDEAALAGLQDFFLDQILHVEPAIDGRTIVGHDVLDADVLESLGQSGFHIASTRGLHQEPSDEDQPQAPDAGAGEEFVNAEDDEEERDRLAGSSGDLRGAAGVSGLPPDNRAQDAAAVERVSGNQIEYGQREVDIAEPEQHRHPGIGSRLANEVRPSHADSADDGASERTDERHPEFDGGAGGIFFDLRDAAQGEQRDFLDRQSVGARDQRMRQLMQEQRNEEQNGR